MACAIDRPIVRIMLVTLCCDGGPCWGSNGGRFCTREFIVQLSHRAAAVWEAPPPHNCGITGTCRAIRNGSNYRPTHVCTVNVQCIYEAYACSWQKCHCRRGIVVTVVPTCISRKARRIRNCHMVPYNI